MLTVGTDSLMIFLAAANVPCFLQERLSQLESEAEELKAAEQAALARTENVTGKLKELIPRYKVRSCLFAGDCGHLGFRPDS